MAAVFLDVVFNPFLKIVHDTSQQLHSKQGMTRRDLYINTSHTNL